MNRFVVGLCVVLCLFTLPAVAATRTWSGAVDNLWSTGGNWSGGIAPADGDSLVFPGFVPNRTNTNDLVGLDLVSLSFGGGEGFPYNISGSAITLSGGIVSSGGTVNWSIPTTLAASQTFDDDYEVDFMGPIDLNGHTLDFDAGVTRLSGSLTGAGTFNLTNGHLNLTGSAAFTGPLTVAPGAVINVTGTIGGLAFSVGSNAVLGGDGTVAAVTLNGAFLRPGNLGNGDGAGSSTTGILTSGDLTMTGGRLDVAIKGTTAGTGYDRLSVAGVVTLNNPQLLVSLPVGSPTPGHAYVIVQNDGAEAIAGTFSGLPEGAIIPVGAATFEITYAGGDGNDVALIAQNAGPKSWTGAVNQLWSNGGNWSDGIAPMDGDSLVFPGFVPNRTNTNDLAGLDLESLSFGGGEGFPYNISGNAITLSGGISAEGTINWSVPTTLAASQTFDDDYEIDFSGPIDLNGHTLNLDAGVTRLSGSLIGTGTFNLTHWHLNLTGSATFTGPLTVAPGAVINVLGTIDGPTFTVGSNAVLAGNGTVAAVTLNGAFLRPGNAGNGDGVGSTTGILTSGDLTMTGGRLDAAIKGATPGSGYDQLSVGGVVTLNNPQLLVSLPVGAPAVGSTYVLVDNDGADPVNGTFSGLPEGAAFFASSTWFRISYAGGSGNDIMLTALQSTTTTLTASPNPVMAGQPATLTATVSSGSGTPAGTVRFVEGDTTLATATLDASGIATATIVLPTGDHSIVAEYEGSGLYAPSSSASVTLAVHAGPDVPALDETGLLMLGLAIAAAGAIAMKR